jgi:outer membrane protein TolC
MAIDAAATIVRTPGTGWHAGLVAAALVCTTALAQAQEASSTRVDGLVREAARRFAQGQPPDPPPPATAGGRQTADQPMRSLSLDDAVKLALERNLDIAVQRSNPEAFDLDLASLKATYLPTVSSLLGNQHQTSTPITLLTGGQHVTTTTSTFNGELTQNVPHGGGSLNVTWNNNRVFSNSSFYNYNPAYNATLTARYTQPLLRGLHTDAARQQLVVTKVNRAISDLQLQTTVVNTLTNVRDAYWDLVFAVQSIDVARRSVDLAHRLVEENQKRVQYGTMTRLDLVTARSQEATSQHMLVQAEGNRRTAELALKRLLVAGPEDPLWQSVLDPAERPDDKPETIDIEAAVRRALNERTDLAQARQQAAANQAAIDYLRDQRRPQADVVGSYALAGLGGTQLLRQIDPQTGNVFNAPIVATLPGAYGGALSSLFGGNYPTWSVALNVSYPIGFSPAKAEAARALIQLRQVETETRHLEVQVVTEVTNAAIQARNNLDQVDTARVARELAQEKLDAEEKKFEAGLSTNYFVVQAQKDLADAQNAEFQALVNYRKSLVDFERAQQTTLQAAGVTIVSPGGLTPPAVGSGRQASPAPSGAFIP